MRSACRPDAGQEGDEASLDAGLGLSDGSGGALSDGLGLGVGLGVGFVVGLGVGFGVGLGACGSAQEGAPWAGPVAAFVGCT